MRGPTVLFVLAIMFLVEAIAWIVLATWGFRFGEQWGEQAAALCAIGAFVLVCAFWALFASPRARVPHAVKLVARVLVLGGAAVTLVLQGQVAAGVAFGLIAALFVWVTELPAVREVLEIVGARKGQAPANE